MSNLTEQQTMVVKLVRSGLSNKQIARELGIGEGTVKTHLHNIFGKLGVTRRYALILSTPFDTKAILASGYGPTKELLS